MSKAFKLLIVSQALANLADIFLRISVMTYVYMLSKSALVTAIIPIVIGISSFLASLFLPLLTQSLALNRILSITQAGKTIFVFFLLLALMTKEQMNLFILYTSFSLISVLDGFAVPASHAIIPRYADDLGKSNALFSVVNEGIQLIGWGLGAGIVPLLGMKNSFFLILLQFALASFLLFLLPKLEIGEVGATSNWTILFRGWSLIRKNSSLRLMLQVNSLEIMANTIWVSSILLVFVSVVLKETEVYWGYVNVLFSLGNIFGGLVAYRYSEYLLKRRWESMLCSVLLMGLLTFILVQFPNPFLFLTISLGIGVFAPLKEVPENVIIQEGVEELYLASVYAAFEVVSTIVFSISVMIMGVISDRWGVQMTFYLATFCLIIESFWIYKQKSALV
ncbi:MFS transporter [Streptococcus sp. 121]|uniref:MFS transporter n=1 Tax=Streptococcus sp. 121 TaxID=2797637 RepID=UPI0018F08F23|nr:MFS transporter [Streptococcus sp. 121]MBJ6746691.1 MFS transporter [Streptococcus sp. 121]